MDAAQKTGNAYALGHEHHELERLIAQNSFIGDLTEHMLQLAGLKPGMHVLDIGCGVGDVSLLALNMVGPEGSVIGIDRSAAAIAIAQQRAQQLQLANLQFLTADVASLELAEQVDALVGRLVLMYFPDPAALLRHLLSYVKPGGLVMFQELDALSVTAEPMCEVFWTAKDRIIEALRRAGADLQTGLKLPKIFQETGLAAPQMLQMARVEHGPEAQGYNWVAELTRTLLPVMQQTGVATPEEVDVDSLASRMRDEVVAKKAVLVLPPFIGAWTRKTEA